MKVLEVSMVLLFAFFLGWMAARQLWGQRLAPAPGWYDVQTQGNR